MLRKDLVKNLGCMEDRNRLIRIYGPQNRKRVLEERNKKMGKIKNCVTSEGVVDEGIVLWQGFIGDDGCRRGLS